MLKATVETPEQQTMLERAAARAGVPLDPAAQTMPWSRCDLVLVSAHSPVLTALSKADGHWIPAVVGVGAPPDRALRVWCWDWLDSTDRVERLALLLPRSLREAQVRRSLRQALAHDLRSPLGVMTGYCELLEEQLLGEMTQKQLQAVGTISCQAERLLSGLETLAATLRVPEA